MARTRPDYRQFALFTTGLTAVLIALGVYTAGSGSGLACAQQWPLCDNGLLPRTLPSFYEWFHRLVAMVTGFVILGVVVAAWRGGEERRTAWLATVALVVLPFQISVGAITVTLDGAIPGGYSVPTQAAHLLLALSIFSLLALSALSAGRGTYRRSALTRSRLALGTSLLALVANAVCSRAVPPFGYGPGMQAAFALTGLVAFVSLLAAAVWLPETRLARYRSVVGVAGAATLVLTLLGRDLLVYTTPVRAANQLLYLVALAAVGIVVYAARGARTDERSSPA